MSNLRKTIKNNAKLALDKSWGKAIAIVLVGVAISLLFALLENIIGLLLDVPNFLDVYHTLGDFIDDVPNTAIISFSITGGIFILSLLVMMPLYLGTTKWFYSKAGGKTDDISSIFYFFETAKSFGKAIWLNILLSLHRTFWAIVFFAPNILLTGAIYTMSPETEIQKIIMALLILLNIFIAICALIFYMIYIQKYFLAQYILIESDNIKCSEAIKLSKKYTLGYKQSLFMFHLSFVGWFIVSLLLLPIIYAAPYTNTAFAIYARYLIAKNGIVTALNEFNTQAEVPEASDNILDEAIDEYE